MKPKIQLRILSAQLIVGFALLGVGMQAHACKWYDAPCKARKAIDQAREAAERAAAAAKAEAERQAAAAKAEADRAAAAAAAAKAEAERQLAAAQNLAATTAGFANLAAADTASKAMGYASYVDRMAKQGLAITTAEMQQIKSDIAKNYGTAAKGVVSSYNTTKAGVLAAANVAGSLWNRLVKQCSASYNTNSNTIIPIFKKAATFGSAEKAAINRIIRTIGSGNSPDAQTATDLKTVAKGVGLFNDNKPVILIGNDTKSNITVSVSAAGGAFGAGVNLSAGFAMDTSLTDGKLPVALVLSAEPTLDEGSGMIPGPNDIAASIDWSLGSAADSAGATFMSISGTASMVSVNAGWSMPDDLVKNMAKELFNGKFGSFSNDAIDALCQTPSLGVSLSLPDPKKAATVEQGVGYSTTLARFKF